MEKYVIVEFDIVTNAIVGYLTSEGSLEINLLINQALTYDTRDEVRYQLGTMLKDRPNKEYRYRAVTQALVLVP